MEYKANVFSVCCYSKVMIYALFKCLLRRAADLAEKQAQDKVLDVFLVEWVAIKMNAWNITIVVKTLQVLSYTHGMVSGHLPVWKSTLLTFSISSNSSKILLILVLFSVTFSSNKSILLRKSMKVVCRNAKLLIKVLKTMADSLSLFSFLSSMSCWSNSEAETINRVPAISGTEYVVFLET